MADSGKAKVYLINDDGTQTDISGGSSHFETGEPLNIPPTDISHLRGRSITLALEGWGVEWERQFTPEEFEQVMNTFVAPLGDIRVSIPLKRFELTPDALYMIVETEAGEARIHSHYLESIMIARAESIGLSLGETVDMHNLIIRDGGKILFGNTLTPEQFEIVRGWVE